jgi:hypothetical protein
MNPGRQLHKHWIKTAMNNGCLLLCFLAACTSLSLVSPTETAPSPKSSLPASTPAAATPTIQSPTAELGSTSTSTFTSTFTSTPLPPDFWQKLPVIPDTISDRVREIYRLGLTLGNNPHIFSRIGDCTSAAPAFLVGFDRNYNLGEYTYLQPAIDYFRGSFERPSLAAKNGLNTAGLLSTLWTGEQCLNKETLLDCQYRLDRPGFAIISVGSNEAYYVKRDPASFETKMRTIIDDTIAQGIVPILGTKADNLEGDHSINATIARLAWEYELPLWNFWAAAQPLPNQGMIDAAHLTTISYINFTDFSISHSLEYGMQVRNLTALQMLYFLWEQLAETPPAGAVGSLTPTP